MGKSVNIWRRYGQKFAVYIYGQPVYVSAYSILCVML